MNEIFVIVENVEGEEVLVVREGYFIDENSAEKRVDEMNEHHLAQIKKELDTVDHDYEPTEDDETHYGFVPLTMNSRNRG